MRLYIAGAGIATLLLAGGAGFLYRGSPEASPAPASQEKADGARLLFVGDMFFDRSIRTVAEKKGYEHLLACVKDRFLSYDGVVGNLEGPITDNASVSVGSVVGSWQNYTFTFAPEVAGLLARHNVVAVSLGNNHIENMGEAGVYETRANLDAAGIGHFGGLSLLRDEPTDVGEPIYRTEIQGEKLSFVAYNQFGGMSPEAVAERVRLEKREGRFVTVLAHWGEEYSSPTAEVRRAASLFVDAGADLIIGAHPHVVQERDIVGDTPVYYSLGNFLFDQFFSAEVQRGLAVEVFIKDGLLQATAEHPTKMLQEERQVCFQADIGPR